MAVPISVCVLVYLLSHILATIIIEKVLFIAIVQKIEVEILEKYTLWGPLNQGRTSAASPELDKVDFKNVCLAVAK